MVSHGPRIPCRQNLRAFLKSALKADRFEILFSYLDPHGHTFYSVLKKSVVFPQLASRGFPAKIEAVTGDVSCGAIWMKISGSAAHIKKIYYSEVTSKMKKSNINSS